MRIAMLNVIFNYCSTCQTLHCQSILFLIKVLSPINGWISPTQFKSCKNIDLIIMQNFKSTLFDGSSYRTRAVK